MDTSCPVKHGNGHRVRRPDQSLGRAGYPELRASFFSRGCRPGIAEFCILLVVCARPDSSRMVGGPLRLQISVRLEFLVLEPGLGRYRARGICNAVVRDETHSRCVRGCGHAGKHAMDSIPVRGKIAWTRLGNLHDGIEDWLRYCRTSYRDADSALWMAGYVHGARAG